ncbi:MAG: ImmA/IrrE family metallo-endopeptidase [Desulfurispora sp.]|uniref:ImmA/IrrE family metallo-endopeptidase n=1 Tax=Desulfurispora sp. TaxID=3014275 RepID=UPI00404AED34
MFELAEKEGIVIEWWDFQPPLEAVYLAMAGMPPVIGLATSLRQAPRAYLRCVLAEEIGHHFTTAGNFLPHTFFHYRQRIEISRAEYLALRWAARHLIPMDRLMQAFRQGIVECWELAGHFEVTEDLVRFRLSLPEVLYKDGGWK